ncbi:MULTISPECIES: HAF repeat-containing protein [unclassified Mesorhizobium]|uniref:HAF repeat-containing protein n=1 Tax=Mesorhizobium sp. L2C089B000 TaxID=1287120 RepID=UPI0003CFD6C9|nr:HAF repeat-containing protein [Mesorhizobium sp. L2C089B000]ESZ09301.1 hypothetical protein X736_03085 [Mesorhizobium sp. L2C089B000]
MTLNLMLATRDSIHVAADLRLSSGGRVVSDASAKVLRIDQPDWQAIVSYCGVGRVRKSKDTSHFIRDWVLANPDESASFPGLLEVLRREGTRWLKSVGFRGAHTFLVGALVAGRSQIAMISNVDRLHGASRATPLSELQIEVDRSPALRTVMCGSGVAAVSKLALQRLRIGARNGNDASQIQRQMAALIRAASNSPSTRNTVSSASYSYSMYRTRGIGHTHGTITGRFEPLTIANGSDMLATIRGLLGPEAQIVPVGNFSAGPGIVQPEPDKCLPVPSQSVPSDERLDLTELPGVGGHAKALCVNNAGLAGGYCSVGDPHPPVACIWSNDLGLYVVEEATAPSQVNGINDAGEIVGTMMVDGGANRAFHNGPNGFRVLDTLGGMHSHGFAINNSGTLIGSSWTIAGNDPGDKGETAFVAGKDLQIRSIGALREGWNSRAVAINNRGVVIGHSWFARTFPGGPQRAFVWSEQGGMIDLGTLGGQGAVPVAINDDGVVVGITSDAAGRDCSFIWTATVGMRELLPGLASTGVAAINVRGNVVFNLHTERGVQSSVIGPDGMTRALQTFVGHETEARAMSDAGQIVGHVLRNRHSHAAMWR